MRDLHGLMSRMAGSDIKQSGADHLSYAAIDCFGIEAVWPALI
jgi:hypothetical protein